MSGIPIMKLRTRAGFSLTEMLIALVLTAIIGAAVTGLFVSQTRFFEAQEKQGAAREVSRSGMNVIVTELRMLEKDSGVISVSDSVISLRVPFAMGISCGATAATTTILMFPVASALYSDALNGYAGYMWRTIADERYTYVAKSANPSAGASATCTAAGISTTAISGSQAIALTPGALSAVARSPVMLYQTVTYRFGSSTSVSGRRALFRQTGTGANEELVAPFDTTARFRFYYGTERGEAVDAAPSTPSDLIGLQLVLDGVSERPNEQGKYQNVPYRTSVFFKNRR